MSQSAALARSAGDSGATPHTGQIAYQGSAAELYSAELISSTTANNFVVACALAGDVLAAPDLYIVAEGAEQRIRYPTARTPEGADVLSVGAGFGGSLTSSPAELRPYVLALRDVVRESATLRPAPAARAAGVLNPWLIGGIVLVVAGVVTYLSDRAISGAVDLRREQLQIAQAASDAAEGERVYRQTGTRPPATPTQTAVADAIRRRAERESANPTPFGTALAAGIQQGMSWGIPLAILLVFLIYSGKKG